MEFNYDRILEFDRDELRVIVGQKRMFHESEKIFTVKEKTYDDRDFYTCILEDGTEEVHSKTIISVYSSCIINDIKKK